MKVCRICRTEKPISEFYYREDTGKHRNECKECLVEIQRYKKLKVCNASYAEMLAEQGGKCAICRCILNSSRYTKLAVDHCHKTGRVRSLLCTNCNTALGLMKDSPDRLKAAASYLEAHAVKI